MANSPHVIDVDGATFESDVVEKSREAPVVVDFWAPWCGPCRKLGPTLEALADEAGGDWILAKVNVDDNQPLAQRYNVRGIPAVKAFVDGAVADEFTGAKPRNAVELWLETLMPSKADADIREGREAEAAGDEARAAEAYEDAPGRRLRITRRRWSACRASNSRGASARRLQSSSRGSCPALRARTQPTSSAPGFRSKPPTCQTSTSSKSRVEADGSNLTARWELAVKIAADERYEDALEHLLQIVIRDREFREDIGRETMVRIFHILGPQSDRTRQWQKKRYR